MGDGSAWWRTSALSGLVLTLVAGAVVGLSTLTGSHAHRSPSLATQAAVGGPTGVVVVMVDDMNDFSCARTSSYLPRSAYYFRVLGTCYENATVTSPVCCPSRASYMTGQYPHNDGVLAIDEGRKLRVQDTLQHQLREAGVFTYGVGKFLNGISMRMLTDIDTGFTDDDLWVPDRYLYYPQANDSGDIYYLDPPVHTTRRTGDLLHEAIADRLDAGGRYYAYAAFTAPHRQHVRSAQKGRLPAATPENRQAEVPPFRFITERNARDKLPVFQDAKRPRRYFERWNTARVRSLYDVDDELAELFQLLDSRDALDDTAVFVTSDNGFQLGRNNWAGKGAPYRASLNVPLLAYLPGTFQPGAVERVPVSLVDLAPTIYEMFGVAPTHVLDGHSLLSTYVRRDNYWELATKYGGEGEDLNKRIPAWAKYELGGRTFIQFYDKRGRVIAEEFYADAGERRNLMARGVGLGPRERRVVAPYRKALRAYRGCAGTVEAGATRPCP